LASRKLDGFVFCKLELTWKRAKTTIKEEEEEEGGGIVVRKTRQASLGTKRRSMGYFFTKNITDDEELSLSFSRRFSTF
jgi:hypothetical protein